MGRNRARMGLTNKLLAKSVLVTGNILVMKKSNREEKEFTSNK